MKKVHFINLMVAGLLLASCGDEESSTEADHNSNSNVQVQPKDTSSTKITTGLFSKVIESYENEHGTFEVLYRKDNLGLRETYEDFGLRVSTVEYGMFSVSDAYDYYPDLEDDEGKIGYVKLKMAMDLPASIDPAVLFFPDRSVLTITQDIPPLTSDNNFADNVAVNLGEVVVEEGDLFYLLSPNDREKLDQVKSFTLSTMAPFTTKIMDMKEGYTFTIHLD